MTNASKGLSTRGVSSPNEPRWLRLLWLSLVVMRCQPLRRALCLLRKYEVLHCRTISREMPRALS
ncbi:hypothetical protein CGT98_17845 [Vibrio metoecus]|nr:hypothetical protein CGT98_17845 [Vibrio metoecus]